MEKTLLTNTRSSILLRTVLSLFSVYSMTLPLTGQTADPAKLTESLQQRQGSSQHLEEEEYKLGGGDEISIMVTGRPELSGVQVVGPDDRISLPMVGAIQVGGLTRDGAALAVSKALSVYYLNASTYIQITKYGSNHILLVGNVEHPGVLFFDQPPTLLEAITRGGSELSSAKGSRFPRKCVVYRGSNQVFSVDLEELLGSSAKLTDIKLQRNDIVFVPGDQDRTISVLGEVKTPGAVVLLRSSTLVRVLADSGGITPQAGNPTIEILQPSTGVIRLVKFKDLLTRGKNEEVALHDGDIVYVPRSGIAKTGFVLQQLAPIAQVGTLATFANR